MFTACQSHIEQHYPKPIYSQVFYLQSVVNVAGDNVASDNIQVRGVRAIFYQFIYIVSQASSQTINVLDQYNQIIFSTSDNSTQLLPAYPILLVKGGQTIKITIPSILGVSFPFTISYQYIS